jgi:membrane-associated phospholipid phosphatase
MDQLYQFSLDLTIWLQDTYPDLLVFFSIISAMGEEEFFLIFLPVIYWSINKRLGRQLGYIFLLSAAANNILKNSFRLPRPYWLNPAVQQVNAEGYGLPSGHVQNTTAILFLAAALRQRSWIWLFAALFIFLSGLSRVYLGVHFIQDVLIGFWIALLVLLIYGVLRNRFTAGFNKRILGQRLLALVAIPVGLGIVYIAILLIIGPPDLTVPWSSYIPAAELNGHEDVVATIAGLLGYGIGVILESSRIRFRSDGPVWQRATRYGFGMAGALVIWAGLRAIFPADPAWIALPLRFIRYFLLLLWVTYFAPWVFVKLRLAASDPEPEARVML